MSENVGFAPCCLESFARWGITTGFALSRPGDQHICEDCGRVYELLVRAPGQTAVWTLVEMVNPWDHNAECRFCDEQGEHDDACMFAIKSHLRTLKIEREERRERFRGVEPVDNSRAVAGAPMVFPCADCNDPLGIVLPEDWLPPRQTRCGPCEFLARLEWHPSGAESESRAEGRAPRSPTAQR